MRAKIRNLCYLPDDDDDDDERDGGSANSCEQKKNLTSVGRSVGRTVSWFGCRKAKQRWKSKYFAFNDEPLLLSVFKNFFFYHSIFFYFILNFYFVGPFCWMNLIRSFMHTYYWVNGQQVDATQNKKTQINCFLNPFVQFSFFHWFNITRLYIFKKRIWKGGALKLQEPTNWTECFSVSFDG